jgi:hypothetical protein
MFAREVGVAIPATQCGKFDPPGGGVHMPLKHDPEKWIPVLGRDHAPLIS